MSDIIGFVTGNWQTIVGVLSGVVGVAALIIFLTPTTKDDSVLRKIVGVLKYIPGFRAPAMPAPDVGGTSEALTTEEEDRASEPSFRRVRRHLDDRDGPDGPTHADGG